MGGHRHSNAQERALSIALVVLFVTVGLAEHAQAYVDLGSGSYMLQLLAAGLFGVMFAARSLWWRIRAVFRRSDPHQR